MSKVVVPELRNALGGEEIAMRRVVSVTIALATTLALMGTLAGAQGKKERRALPTWDPKTVITIKGTVDAVTDIGRQEFVAIGVKTDTGGIPVLLNFDKELDPALSKLSRGTAVEVTGSKTKINVGKQKQADVILAQTVKVDGKEYKLRNDQGQLLAKNGQPLNVKQ
jgi:hypothetical protein